ncbi:MAG: xylulokinase [Candidatus Bipolaricaulaceae bacterium]
MVFLAIDIGTSVTKVVAFDEKGRICVQARASYPTHRPQPGWAEQDPEDWWKAVSEATRLVMRKLRSPKRRVEAVGLTGQMHGLVLLGRNGKPLLPCLIWMDTRAGNQAKALAKSVGEQKLLSRTGNRPIPAFPAAKFLWVRENLPRIYKGVRWLLMPKDYIGYRLTGVIGTDPSDASGTLLYNLQLKDWDEEIVGVTGLRREFLPPISSSTSLLGKVTAKAAKELPLPAGTPVILGGGDLATSALGVGAVTPEQVGLILGTAGQLLFAVSESFDQLLGKFYLFAHALPGSFLGLGTLPTGGAALAWLARALKVGEKGIEKLISSATDIPPGANGLFFLPYLAGTGTPYMDYEVRAAFLGLAEAHGPEHIVRAVLEGIGYALRDSLQLLWDLGMCKKEIMIAGGSMRSRALRQIFADILGRPLHLVRTIDASPLGTFFLTAVGLGLYADLREVCKTGVKIRETVVPTTLSDYYAKGFEVFRYYSQRWRTEFRLKKMECAQAGYESAYTS